MTASTPELTVEQRAALEWVDRNEHHTSEWITRGGRRGGTFPYTHLRIEGPRGSIVIPLADQEAIRDYLAPAEPGSHRIYSVTPAGRDIISW